MYCSSPSDSLGRQLGTSEIGRHCLLSSRCSIKRRRSFVRRPTCSRSNSRSAATAAGRPRRLSHIKADWTRVSFVIFCRSFFFCFLLRLIFLPFCGIYRLPSFLPCSCGRRPPAFAPDCAHRARKFPLFLIARVIKSACSDGNECCASGGGGGDDADDGSCEEDSRKEGRKERRKKGEILSSICCEPATTLALALTRRTADRRTRTEGLGRQSGMDRDFNGRGKKGILLADAWGAISAPGAISCD